MTDYVIDRLDEDHWRLTIHYTMLRETSVHHNLKEVIAAILKAEKEGENQHGEA